MKKLSNHFVFLGAGCHRLWRRLWLFCAEHCGQTETLGRWFHCFSQNVDQPQIFVRWVLGIAGAGDKEEGGTLVAKL